MDVQTQAFHAFPMGKQRKRPKPAAPKVHERLQITEALAALGKTQAWLAEQTGYSDGYISLLNKGKRRANQEVVRIFEAALKVPAGTLTSSTLDPELVATWGNMTPAEQARLVRAVKDPKD